jgi:hypothetical protein
VRLNYLYIMKEQPPPQRLFGIMQLRDGWYRRQIPYNVLEQMRIFQEYNSIHSAHLTLNRVARPLFFLQHGPFSVYPVFDTAHYPNPIVPLSLVHDVPNSRVHTVGLIFQYAIDQYTVIRFHMGFFCSSGELIGWDANGKCTTILETGKWRLKFGFDFEPSYLTRVTVIKDFIPYWQGR